MVAHPRLLPLCATVLVAALLLGRPAVAADPASSLTTKALAKVMLKAPTKQSLTYRDARRALLKRLRADLDEAAAVPVLLKLLRNVRHADDSLLRVDVVEALPGEARMVDLLGRIAKDRLAGGPDDDAFVDVLMTRLGSSQNPAYLSPLIKYLEARSRKLKSPFGSAYDSLLRSFPQEARAVEFLWSHELPAPADARRRPTYEVLRRYAGDDARRQLLDMLECPRVACRGLAIAIANKRTDPGTRKALMASLAELANTPPTAYEAWIKPLKRLEQLAAKGEDTALFALIDVAAAAGANMQVALAAARRVLGDRRRQPAPTDRLEALLALGERPEPVFEAFDVLEHLDVRPVTDRLSRLLDDDMRAGAAAYAAVEGGGDKVIAQLVDGIADRSVDGQLALLDALYLPYQAQAWGRSLVPLLAAEESEVARAATALLIRSTDPAVRSRLEGITRSDLQRLASPYHAVRDGLRLQWSLTGSTVQQGAELKARVVVSNGGVLPFNTPPAIPHRYERWQIMAGDVALGPLELFPVDTEGEPIDVLWDGGEVIYEVDVGRALSALGPGRHLVRLAFFSRALHERDRARPDFARETLPKALEVTEAPAIRSWLASATGVRTWAESPDDAYRETGWKRFESLHVATKVEAPLDGAEEGEIDEIDVLLAKLGKRGKLGRGEELSVRIESQAAPTEEYRIDAKGRFIHTRRVEGPAGEVMVKLGAGELKEFFALLRSGRPFDHEPLQVLGLPREPLASVRLVAGGMNLVAPPLWMAELQRHPKTRRWMRMLEGWRDRAAGVKR